MGHPAGESLWEWVLSGEGDSKFTMEVDDKRRLQVSRGGAPHDFTFHEKNGRTA